MKTHMYNPLGKTALVDRLTLCGRVLNRQSTFFVAHVTCQRCLHIYELRKDYFKSVGAPYTVSPATPKPVYFSDVVIKLFTEVEQLKKSLAEAEVKIEQLSEQLKLPDGFEL